MASAFQQSGRPFWYAKIRGLWQQPGKYSVLRVPASRVRLPKTAQRDAGDYAAECERYCRLLEVEGAVDAADVAHARRIGAITGDQADALTRGLAVPPRSAIAPDVLTVRAAALSHPSTARDPVGKQGEYLRYLDQFTAHADTKDLHRVTIDHVLSWIAAMRAQGLSWDTRRHHLLYLRRAFVMGRRKNIPDQLAGLKLDHKAGDSTDAIRTWTLRRLLKEIDTCADVRRRAILAMGGLLGMRPSEIVRADVPDLVGDLLAIGVRDRKNDQSRRTLPVPATALRLIKPAIGTRKVGALIKPKGRHDHDHLSVRALNQLMADILRETDDPIATKDLRKTFATWASTVLPAADLERYLGHATALHAAITARHYLAAHQAEQLRPAAAQLETAISAACLFSVKIPNEKQIVEN